MEAPVLEGPRGQIPYLSYPDLGGCGILRIGRRRGLPFRPYLHARISRITVVEQLPQIIIVKIRRPNGEALETSRRPTAGQ